MVGVSAGSPPLETRAVILMSPISLGPTKSWVSDERHLHVAARPRHPGLAVAVEVDVEPVALLK